jgi:hypothetical protein
LHGRLGGSQSRSGSDGEEKNFPTSAKNATLVVEPVAKSLIMTFSRPFLLVDKFGKIMKLNVIIQ